MSREYRIAIIGIGAIADLHARSIDELPNAKLRRRQLPNQEQGRRFRCAVELPVV